MGRLEDIIERNKHPRRHRKARFPFGIAVSLFVLIILVLLVFTDLNMPGGGTPPPPPAAEDDGRVRGIELRSAPRVVRDAGTRD